MKALPSFLVLSMLLFLCVGASAINIAEEIPFFSVVSPDGQMLIRDDLAGKTVILFYESRSKLDLNQELKQELAEWELDKDRVVIVFVVDCSDLGLLKIIWQERLKDYERRMKHNVYGDWNGNMKEKFAFDKDEGAYLLVADSRGIILHMQEGELIREDIKSIMDCIPMDFIP